ncbi:hypothetical protein ACOSP7_016907 [Xanthoceras sorbifolium]
MSSAFQFFCGLGIVAPFQGSPKREDQWTSNSFHPSVAERSTCTIKESCCEGSRAKQHEDVDIEADIPTPPEVIHKFVGLWMVVSHVRGNKNFQGNGCGRFASGLDSKMNRDVIRGGSGAVNVKASGGIDGLMDPKFNATEKIASTSGGVAKEKDLKEADSEVRNFQKGKGKATWAKQKGVLNEVTNLKMPSSNSKKLTKAKVNLKLGDSGIDQKKIGGSASKGKKHMIRNSSSGNDQVYFWPEILASKSTTNRVDNL